ncbi:hypothetical protein XHV734_3846 [Xanthomonas hortorum pv. vitians]|nr:hypothetical protein XHV734_3846 [Xanthomonas hortorum pv. vitians]
MPARQSLVPASPGAARVRHHQPAGRWRVLVWPDGPVGAARRHGRRARLCAYGSHRRARADLVQVAQTLDAAATPVCSRRAYSRLGSAAGRVQFPLRPHLARGVLQHRGAGLLSVAGTVAGAVLGGRGAVAGGVGAALSKRCAGRDRDRGGAGQFVVVGIAGVVGVKSRDQQRRDSLTSKQPRHSLLPSGEGAPQGRMRVRAKPRALAVEDLS